MGLRCSLLGHDFGDAEVEREREERGSEVVLTVREVAECARCGKTNVVSENKEVTALHDEDEDADRRDDTEQTSLSDTAPATSAGDEPEAEDAADDAVIISDDEEDDKDDGRKHGEWPEPDRPAEDEDEDADDGPAEWPTVETEDEGFDAQPSPGGTAAVEFGGGLAPERTDVEEEEGIEYVESVEAEPATAEVADADGGVQVEPDEADAGFVKADAAPSPAEPAGADVDSEFVCPQCGFVDDVIGSSLRAGDVCPDCRRGYLSERER